MLRVTKNPNRSLLPLVIILAIVSVAVVTVLTRRSVQADNELQTATDEMETAIDNALYRRVEFFGSQALVPYPTVAARDRLAAVQAKYPDRSQIYLRLAHLDEKLGRDAEALKEMQSFVALEPDKLTALGRLAEYLHRRIRFDAEAETREEMLKLAPPEKRVALFRELMQLAETHRLEKYLAPRFYEAVLAENPDAFEIVEQYVDKLIGRRDYQKALSLLREYKDRFPDRREWIVDREISIHEAMSQPQAAEAVFQQSFDPFWPAARAYKFYDFLKDHDRFRAYGQELRASFRRDPTNFAVAVRLLHYAKYSDAENAADIFVRLEKARAVRHIQWQRDELLTMTRLLLKDDYGEAASRFLYTLYLQGEMKPGSELRAKVLYQLFEILSDAGEQRLSLTQGDLKFYQSVATADPHPGMLGGIL